MAKISRDLLKQYIKDGNRSRIADLKKIGRVSQEDINSVNREVGTETKASKTAEYTKALKDTYSYQKIQNMNMSEDFKQEFSNYLQEYKNTNKIKNLTWDDIKNAIASMPVETRTQFPDDYDKLTRAIDTMWLESKYGYNKTSMIDELTDPDILKKKFDEVLAKVKDNPVFKKYRDSQVGIVEKQEQYDIEDYNKLTEYAKDEYIQNLAKTDTYLASSLQKATEQYGMRWVLGWTPQNAQTQEITTAGDQANLGYKTDMEKILEKSTTGINRAKEAYNINMQKIDAQKSLSADQLALDELNKWQQTKLDTLTKLL